MEGRRLTELVNAYRTARDEALLQSGLTQSASPDADCNNAPVPPKPKRKSYPLPPLPGPTEIPGYPLNPSPPAEAPDYGNMGRVAAIKRRQRDRKMDPIGPPELIKRGDVRTWKVAE